MARRCLVSGTLLVLALALNSRSLSQDAATAKSGSTIDAKTRAILEKLEKPVPLTFDKVPLGDVFEYVTKATAVDGDEGVRLVVDPGALEKARVRMTTRVTFESEEGESLKDSLRGLLGWQGLTYRVEDGAVRVSALGYSVYRRSKSQYIVDRLRTRADLTFETTPLREVVDHIKKLTAVGPNGKGIPILIDPVGLKEVEATFTTPISFTAKNETLKSSLRRLLKPVNLTYLVKDGLLTITSRTPDDPERAARDAAVLDAVLDDLVTKSHPESPLFDKTHIFLAPEEIAPSLKVSEVIHELQLREFDKVSPADLALGREAASDLIHRKDVADVLNDFTPTDKRVILWDDTREEADRKQVFFNRAQVFRSFAPGYSRDHKFAIVHMRYPLDIHAGWGSWGLARRNGKWVVVFRDLWSS